MKFYDEVRLYFPRLSHVCRRTTGELFLFRFFSEISLFSRLDTKTKAMIVPVDIPGHLPTLEVPVVVIGVTRRTPAAPPLL